MSQTYHIHYKCRRCGEVFLHGAHGTHDGVIDALRFCLVNGDENALKIKSTVFFADVHQCHDGGMGIADLTGASPNPRRLHPKRKQ